MEVKASLSLLVQRYTPETHARSVLLFNPPVYDTRFPWSRFQQPVALLQLSTFLRRCGCDVRLVDALFTNPTMPLRRRRMRVVMRGDIPLNWWRFGRLPSDLKAQLRTLKKEGWQPDDVYVEGFTTFWWEGAAEAITLIRQHFPRSRVILFGAYPTLAPTHAVLHSGADLVIVGSIERLAGLPLDLSLYASSPTFTHLAIGTKERSLTDLVEEFRARVKPNVQQERIGHIAFIDHDVARRFPEQFHAVLQESIDQKYKVSFYALGNLHPRDLVDDPALALQLFRAGFKQITFADDRSLPPTPETRETLLEDYRCAINYCIEVGYRWRTEALAASVCLGRPGEDPGEVAAFMTQLAHIAGSIIVIPYQPTPDECPATLPLELQNGKLFPFAEDNSLPYRGYQDILGLAAVLNAKYRSHTFDFLGDGLIPRLVRSSLNSQSWKPHTLPKQDRPVTVGWFNKEGKWVRS